MTTPWLKAKVSRFLSDYGMVLVLALLCAFFSYVTWAEQHPAGAAAAELLTRDLLREAEAPNLHVLIVAGESEQERAFADTLRDRLTAAGATVLATVKGQPGDARRALKAIAASQESLDVIAADHAAAQWAVLGNVATNFPSLAQARIATAPSYWWPNFLKGDNLLNVANQIVVIAILAIGMTMVIIAAGIDLSVGSLIALSAVAAAVLVRDWGAETASPFAMILASLAGISACAVLGMFSGLMITLFAIPPFIVTLAMMLVGSGLAYILAKGQTIYQVPDTCTWLGRGIAAFGVPNAVVLMVLLYAAAHVLMSRMALGRYIYAVGGNPEAARLSGVPVKRVLLFVYTLCGALAGLGGIVTASQLKSGSPTFGLMYELYAIAAVVVGGTSLSGGEGKILGTLIGALIIAVIQNGMNLTGVESYTQKVVLGLVILGAVLLDRLKRRGWGLLRPRRRKEV